MCKGNVIVEEKPNTGFQNQREEKGIGVCEATEDLFDNPKVENQR